MHCPICWKKTMIFDHRYATSYKMKNHCHIRMETTVFFLPFHLLFIFLLCSSSYEERTFRFFMAWEFLYIVQHSWIFIGRWSKYKYIKIRKGWGEWEVSWNVARIILYLTVPSSSFQPFCVRKYIMSKCTWHSYTELSL
jgi:hypothetical protein